MNSNGVRALCGYSVALLLAACGGSDPSPGAQDITYELAFQPTAPRVTQGDTVTVAVEVKDDGVVSTPDERESFTSPVDLRLVASLPAGLEGAFDPGTLRPGVAGTLALSAALDAPAGKYRLEPAGTLSGSSTTQFFALDAEVIGNCAPGTGGLTAMFPSSTGRTAAVGQDGSVFIWGANSPRAHQQPVPTPGVGPETLAYYTAQRVPGLPPARFIASAATQSVVVPADGGPLLVVGPYWQSAVGAPNGQPGWQIETLRRADGSAIDGFQQVLIPEEYNFNPMHLVGLHRDGTVWTIVQGGDVTALPGVGNVVKIAAGFGHLLALRADGVVFAWGRNDSGQLGDGTNDPAAMPIQVPGLTDIRDIAAGGDHSLALRADGTVLAWGKGDSGQLGNGSQANALRPVQVVTRNDNAISAIVAIAAGDSHSLAVADNLAVWSWGDNSSGELGSGAGPARTVAERIDGVEAREIFAGGLQSFARLSATSAVQGWGHNGAGQLGNGTAERSFTPEYSPGLGVDGRRCRELPAEIVFEDSDFAAGDWQVAFDGVSAPGGPTQTTVQVATGGNPGAGPYRQMTHSMPANSGAFQVIHLKPGAVYSPAAQGAITSLDYREDRRLFSETANGDAVASQLAFSQSGRFYRAAFAPMPDVESFQWTTATSTAIVAQNFVQVAGPACGLAETCPDFSARGAPITFGYFRSTLNSETQARIVTHGIDNWRVAVRR